MIILGIHGAIGHGKTTFADMLQEVEPNSAHFESSTIIAQVLDELHQTLNPPFTDDPIAFVNEWFDELPRILKAILNIVVTSEQLRFTEAALQENPVQFQKLLEHAASLQKDPSLVQHKVSAENKSLYRAGLQGFGGYLITKLSPTIWYDEIVRQMAVQKEEGRNLSVAGGLRFPAEAAVIRKAGGIVIEIVRPDVPEQDSQDPTEAFRKQIVSDTRIINNGNQQQLALLAPLILDDIRENRLKQSYSATD